jgi:8-oxo-dGTP pyrophosphatase MutT (NUDIX family)
MSDGPLVRAAGGVVWRPSSGPGPSASGPTRGAEVVLVHRPRYEDWTFPKGKADPGESDEDCARREVFEETGLTCELGAPLAEVVYTDRAGRPKVVRYWSMTVSAAVPFEPNAEVDEVRWLLVDQAGHLLTYPRDRDVLSAFIGNEVGGPARILP